MYTSPVYAYVCTLWLRHVATMSLQVTVAQWRSTNSCVSNNGRCDLGHVGLYLLVLLAPTVAREKFTVDRFVTSSDVIVTDELCCNDKRSAKDPANLATTAATARLSAVISASCTLVRRRIRWHCCGATFRSYKSIWRSPSPPLARRCQWSLRSFLVTVAASIAAVPAALTCCGVMLWWVLAFAHFCSVGSASAAAVDRALFLGDAQLGRCCEELFGGAESEELWQQQQQY